MAISDYTLYTTEARDDIPMKKNFNAVYEIQKRLTFFLRDYFSKDDIFHFVLDQSQSKLKIVTEYPDTPDIIQKIPHLVISGVQGRISPNTSMFHNFFRDVYGDEGQILYQERLYSFDFNATIFCVANNSSSCLDLGNAVQNAFAVSGIFDSSDYYGLNHSDVVLGTPVIRQQHPFRIYESAVSLGGQLQCIERREYSNDFTKAKVPAVLKNVKIKTKIDKQTAELEQF